MSLENRREELSKELKDLWQHGNEMPSTHFTHVAEGERGGGGDFLEKRKKVFLVRTRSLKKTTKVP